MPDKYLSKLPVMERFYTLQGEGRYAGQAAYFIRLSGCDVGCHWCDVKESWDISEDQYVETDDLVTEVRDAQAKIVVITGGEPFTHDLSVLTFKLQCLGIKTHVETAGVFPITGKWNWICLSPKKFKPALPQYFALADELKVIVYNHSDLEWAEQQRSKLNSTALTYLQAEWSKAPELSPVLVNYIKNNPEWILSIQTHKYLAIP